MPRRPTGSPRALQRGRIRMDGETVSPACCGSSRSYWVSYVRNVVCPLYVPPPPGDKFWPFLDSYSARFRAQTDSPTASVHFSSPAIPREKGARRDTLRQLASGGRAIISIETRSSRGWLCTCPLGIAEICRLVSLRCSRARMPESHDRPATWVPGTRPARLDHPAPPSPA